MNRREFTGHLAAGAALVAAGTAMEGCAIPNWVNVALADLPTILSIATTVASIVADAATGGTLTPAIAAVIATATAAINVAIPVIQKLIADYQANPTASTVDNIKTAMLDVQNQLGQILTAAHILNPTLRTVITTSMGLAIGVVTAILSLLPASTAAAALPHAKAATAAATGAWTKKPTDPATIKTQFDAFLTQNGYGKYAI